MEKKDIIGMLGLPADATDFEITRMIRRLRTGGGKERPRVKQQKRSLRRGMTVRNAIEKHRTVFPFEGAWRDAFDQPETTGIWFIWGKSGNGKTSFALKLCKELARWKRVAYNSLEEGDSLTFAKALQREGLDGCRNQFLLLPSERMDDLDYRLSQKKSPDVVVIDSFQYTRMNHKEALDFCDRHRDKLIIFISQAEGSKPLGRSAQSLLYDAHQKIRIEGYRAFSLGRYKGASEYYEIWSERAREYWGEE